MQNKWNKRKYVVSNHYIVAENWLLLLAFLMCYQPHHKHSSTGCHIEYPLCWHTKVFSAACNI
jgi:hypothetical protein